LDTSYKLAPAWGMYHKNYQEKLYTKEAIEAGDAQSMKETMLKR